MRLRLSLPLQRIHTPPCTHLPLLLPPRKNLLLPLRKHLLLPLRKQSLHQTLKNSCDSKLPACLSCG